MNDMHDDIQEIILDESDIRDINRRLGEAITKDYADKNPIVLSVLKGAVLFTADLIREIKCPCEIDFMAVSSYGNATKSSGDVRIVKDLDGDISGRHILISEDILDSGLTLDFIIDLLKSRNPASVEVCAFTVKDIENRVCKTVPKYVGAHVADQFIVGYGLDYAERYRNLPYVGVLKPEVYS